MRLPSVSSAAMARLAVLGLGVLVVLDAVLAGSYEAGSNTVYPAIASLTVRLLAPLLYVFALWFLTDLFSVSTGKKAFSRSAVRNLKTAGSLILLGSWVAVLLEPSLLHLIGNQFTQMAGVRLAINTESAVLFVLGLLLIMLASRGSHLKDQLDSFV